MQKEFHLFPDSEGELRWSLEHSNSTCGSSASTGTSRVHRMTYVSQPPARRGSICQSSFILSHNLNFFLLPTAPCQCRKHLLPWSSLFSFSSYRYAFIRKDIWQLYIPHPWLSDGSFYVKGHQGSLLSFLPGAFLVFSLVIIVVVVFLFIIGRPSLVGAG